MSITEKRIPSNEVIVEISNATIRHLDHVLFENLSLEIKKGQQWAILGESGSGKTALLHTMRKEFNILRGYVRHPHLQEQKEGLHIQDPLFTTRGFISFIRQQARFRNKERMHHFFYQQRYHSYFAEEAATVAEYLKEELEKNEANKVRPILFSLDWIIENLQLSSLLDKTLIQISNGETRRLMIASALLKQPMLLLMDNPYIGLDTATRKGLDIILKKIVEKDITLVMATSPREIPEVITHILYLKDRKIIFKGKKSEFKIPEELKKMKAHTWQPELQLLSEINSLKPVQDHSFRTALKLEHIFVKSSGRVILHDIDWEVKKGEKWSLFGPNGAGKSTLLSIINGDHPQTYSNKVCLFDHKRGMGESLWDIKKKIGYVSPELHQYFRKKHQVSDVILSGFEDSLGFNNRKIGEHEFKLTDLWLKLLNLSPLKEKRLDDVSEGEQRLVLLIRALIKNPPLLILDEPCQGLDDEQREHFKSVIDILWNDPEKTLLYVSHYKEDIPSCVTKVLEINNGTIKK